MSVFGTLFFTGAFILISLLWLYAQERQVWRMSNIPQPFGHPIFGPKQQLGPHPSKRLEELGLTQGELFHMKVGLKHFVYVNSWEAVREIFDRQSAKTSAKGPWRGATQIISGLRVAVMPYNLQWRRLRTILHRLLHPTVARNFWPSQDFEAMQLATDFLETEGENTVCKEQAHRMALSGEYGSMYP